MEIKHLNSKQNDNSENTGQAAAIEKRNKQ